MKVLFHLAMLCAVLIFASCQNDSLERPKTGPPNDLGIMPPSFWDPGFDPFPETDLDNYLSLNGQRFVSNFADGLSFLSDYIAENYEDFDPDPLVVYNAYLASISESSVEVLPSFCTDPYDWETGTGLSTAVENAITGVFEEADFGVHDLVNESNYLILVDAIDGVNLAGLSNAQKDTVATILYSHQMLWHWLVYEPMWYDDSQPGLDDGQIKPRYRLCFCVYCLCYWTIYPEALNMLGCITGVQAAAGAAGASSGAGAAVGAGVLAFGQLCW
jgi:hypothetical protein